MLFQDISFSQEQLTILFTTILGLFTLFILGVLITRWWAIKYGWDDFYKSSFALNSFWFIIDLICFIIIIYLGIFFFIALFCAFIIKLFMGSLINSRLYQQKYKKSLIFVLFILIVLLLFYFIVYLILIVILAIFLLAI